MAVPYGSGKASAVDAWGRGLCLAAQCPDRPRGGGKHEARRADPSETVSVLLSNGHWDMGEHEMTTKDTV